MSSEHDDRYWAALPLPPDVADDDPDFVEEFGVTPGEVRAWVSQDPERQRRAAELEAELEGDLAVFAQLREERTLPPIMLDFTARVMAEVREPAAPPRGQLLVFRRYGLAAAAAVLFLVTLGALWGTGGEGASSRTAEERPAESAPPRSADDVLEALPVLAQSTPAPGLLPGVTPYDMRDLDPQLPVDRASGGAQPTNPTDLLLRRFLEDLPNLRENLEELRRAAEPERDETFRF